MILTLGKADESNGDDGRMDEGCREDDVDERELSLIEVAMSSIIAMQLLLLGAISFLLDVVCCLGLKKCSVIHGAKILCRRHWSCIVGRYHSCR